MSSAALGEVITHSLDATLALGIDRQIDPERVVPVREGLPVLRGRF